MSLGPRLKVSVLFLGSAGGERTVESIEIMVATLIVVSTVFSRH